MFATTLAIAALQTSEYFGTGRNPGKLGSAHPRNAPYQAFQARDGYLALAAGNDGLWRAACEVIGQPQLADDAQFASTALRARHQDALREIFHAAFATRSVAELLEAFGAAGVPCAPINRYSQVLADPQVQHMEWVRPLALPGGTVTRTFASPVRMQHQRFDVRRRPPALGEHTAEVLTAIGIQPPSQP